MMPLTCGSFISATILDVEWHQFSHFITRSAVSPAIPSAVNGETKNLRNHVYSQHPMITALLMTAIKKAYSCVPPFFLIPSQHFFNSVGKIVQSTSQQKLKSILFPNFVNCFNFRMYFLN